MKKIVLIAIVVGGLCATFFLVTQKTPNPSAESPKVESSTTEKVETVEQPKSVSANRTSRRAASSGATESSLSQNEAQSSPANELTPEEILAQKTIFQLISPQSSFEQKQALWKQLQADGRLDQTIAELEKQATNNPTADIPATLGYAYIQKIQASKDQRDQAVLAMKADKSFDEALNLDPANWDAQFFKTTSMTYWPEQMNKGPEILQRFTDLIAQQESMPTQPQFARTYYLLGEQYQKSGRPEEAKQVWQRGVAMFPENQGLQKKLATP